MADNKVELKEASVIPILPNGRYVLLINGLSPNLHDQLAETVREWLYGDSDSPILILVTENKGDIQLVRVDEEPPAQDETEYLLSNPANAAHLQQSIAEEQSGQLVGVEFVDGVLREKQAA